MGQGVPAHVGTPTFGYGYESGDPYSSFLPPAVPIAEDDDGTSLRAMVIVLEETEKVGQEYRAPLLVLSGEEYASSTFQVLHSQICDALRGSRPALVAEIIDQTGSKLIFVDGTVRERATDEVVKEIRLVPRPRE